MMKSRSWLLALAAAASLALVSPGAGAQPDKKDARKEARDERKDARKDLKDAREDLKDAKKDLKEAVKDGGGADAQAIKEAKEDLKEARKKLKDSREDRRKAAKGALKAKWGDDLLKKPAVKNELRLHAQRMAKLRHMKRVADEAGKNQLEERIAKLIEKEQARHQARMDALKAKNGEDK